jgi:hypothetical protein
MDTVSKGHRPGWAVFPLFPIVDGKCACGKPDCAAVGKHPGYPYSQLGKAEQVRGRDGCGYGIATGERSDVFVVDFDTLEALETMASDPATPLPDTFMVETARGAHLYFKWPGFRVRNSASELAPKVDVRGDGGFVVAPGSPHKSGLRYEELPEVQEIADAPAWLLAWSGLKAVERTAREAGSNAPIPVDVDTDKGANRIATARSFLASEPPCVEGQGGSAQLWRVALHLVRDLELPLETCRELIEGTGYNARCEPPWSDAEIAHKLEDARDKSDRIPGSVDMAGYVAKAGAMLERQRAELVESRAVPVTPEAPHDYTFDPTKDVYFPKRNEDGKYTPTPGMNMSQLLWELETRPEWAGVFHYNEFADKIVARRPPFKMALEAGLAFVPDEDIATARAWFLFHTGLNVVGHELASAIRATALRHPFHPVRDYLNSLPPTQTRHLDNLAAVLFGDDRPIAQVYVRKHMIAACARAFEPGPRCKVDASLTLVGPRALNKTRTCEEMHRVPGHDVFRSGIPDLKDDRAVGQAAEGNWVIELAELDAARKSTRETYKAWATRTVENYSPKHVKGEIKRPRGFVAIATLNDWQGFLPKNDPAFNRRFWPVFMHRKMDLALWRKIEKEAWAEAMALYRAYAALTTQDEKDASEAWWFNDETASDVGREDCLVTSPLEEMILDCQDDLEGRNATAIYRWATGTTRYAPGSEYPHSRPARKERILGPMPTQAQINEVGDIMRALGGWEMRKRDKVWQKKAPANGQRVDVTPDAKTTLPEPRGAEVGDTGLDAAGYVTAKAS